MKIYKPAETTSVETVARYGDFGAGDLGPEATAQAWTDAGFGDQMAARWLQARCFDASAARELAELGVTPEQASCRTRDGGGYLDTIAFKVAKGDLTPRQGAARCLSSR